MTPYDPDGTEGRRRRVSVAGALRMLTRAQRYEKRLGFEFDVYFAGDCQAPAVFRRDVEKSLIPPKTNLGIRWDKGVRLWVHARCRRCEACLLQKQRMWFARMLTEQTGSGGGKTWFVTLTYFPEPNRRIQSVCGTDVSRFRRMRGKDISEYMKRVRARVKRKGGEPIRFIAAPEVGAGGNFHWHLIIWGGARKRDLVGRPFDRRRPQQRPIASPWQHGRIQHARMVTASGASCVVGEENVDTLTVEAVFAYVAKYLVKQGGRLLVSKRLGVSNEVRNPPQISPKENQTSVQTADTLKTPAQPPGVID